MKRLRFKCVVCGKLTSGRWAKNYHRGTWDYRYPRKHKDSDGKTCKGCYLEAEWVQA